VQRILDGLDRVVGRLEIWLTWVAGLGTFVIMLIGCREVFFRALFNSSLYGHVDIIEQLMVGVAAFGISYCQARNGHVRMTLLIDRAGRSGRRVLETLALSASAFIVGVLVVGTWRNFQRAWLYGGDTPELRIPIWYASSILTASLFLLFIRLILQLLQTVSHQVPERSAGEVETT